jgi:hypothetical protein
MSIATDDSTVGGTDERTTGPAGQESGEARPVDPSELLDLGRYMPWTDVGNGELLSRVIRRHSVASRVMPPSSSGRLAAVCGDLLRYDDLRGRWLI